MHEPSEPPPPTNSHGSYDQTVFNITVKLNPVYNIAIIITKALPWGEQGVGVGVELSGSSLTANTHTQRAQRVNLRTV